MSLPAYSSTGRRLLIGILALGLIGSAAAARAQGFISPLVGYDFAGDAQCPRVSDVVNCKDARLNIGVSVGMMGNLVGGEVEVAYAPDFFGTGSAVSSSVLTMMANVMLAPKLGPVRPYVVGGVGVMKSHIDLTSSSVFTSDNNSFGWDVGGGLMGFFGAHVGLRGDLRYFHSFKDLDVLGFTLENPKLDFGRASVGVVFKF